MVKLIDIANGQRVFTFIVDWFCDTCCYSWTYSATETKLRGSMMVICYFIYLCFCTFSD